MIIEREAGGESISLEEIRAFIATSRSQIVPEKVAALLTERALTLREAQERKTVFGPLVENIEQRLTERGIPLPFTSRTQRTFTAKERDLINSLGILLVHISDGLHQNGQYEESIRYARRAENTSRLVDNKQILTAALDLQALSLWENGTRSSAEQKQEEAYQIAVEADDRKLIRRALVNMGSRLIGQGKASEAIRTLYRALDMSGNTRGDRGVDGLAYLHLAAALTSIQDLESANDAVQEGLESIGEDFPEIRSILLYRRIYLHQLQEELSAGFETAAEALALARLHSTDLHTARVYLALGALHQRLGSPTEAKKACQEAARLLARSEDIPEQVKAQVTLATILTGEGNFEEALDIYHRLLEKNADWPDEPGRHSWILANAGEIYEKIGRYQEAEDMYRKGLQLCKNAGIARGISGTLFNIGNLNRKAGKIDAAITAFEEMLEQADSERQIEMAAEAHRTLSELYEQNEDPSEALHHLKICLDLTNKAREAQHDEKLNQLRIQHEVANHRESAELERLRREQTETRLQELTLSLGQKSESINKLREQVNGLIEGLETARIPTLNAALKRIIHFVADIESLSSPTSLLHSPVSETFYAALRAQHPDLTTGQIKLCGLIRSGMASDQIAQQFRISGNSLKTRRYRLRMRLQLKTGESLEGYLAGIGGE